MDRLLTWDEAAERLNTTPRNVRRLAFERRIAYRKLGRYVRFHPDDLEEYISATRHTYRQLLDYQILPTFEKATLAGVDMLLVREWLAALVEADLSPSRIRNAHQVLSQVLATAVEANRLARNPAKGVRLPRIVRREMHFLTAAQVEQLAAAITVPFPLLVRFDAYTGLRAGELAALRVGRLDLLRGTCEVVESATEVDNKLVWGVTKTTSGARCGCLGSCVSRSAPTSSTGRTHPTISSLRCSRVGRFGSRSSRSATSSRPLVPLVCRPSCGCMIFATPARAC
jgi:excisionase family DNA binding protein